MDIGGYQSHPLADVFPLIEGEAFDALVADIKANGLITPIVLWNGSVLDGRNRLRACIAAGETPMFEEFEGSDEQALAYVVATNLHRRHLSESQRAMVAARLVESGANSPSLTAAAASLNVSTRSAYTARNVLRSGDSNVVNLVERGEMSVRKADMVTRGELSTDELDKDGRKDRKHPPVVRRFLAALGKLQACQDTSDRLVKAWPTDEAIDIQKSIVFLRSLQSRTQGLSNDKTAVA